jgi:hypothetical protein
LRRIARQHPFGPLEEAICKLRGRFPARGQSGSQLIVWSFQVQPLMKLHCIIIVTPAH